MARRLSAGANAKRGPAARLHTAAMQIAIDDLPSAVEELRAAGIELVGQAGLTWRFRGPDGNVYELVARSGTGDRGGVLSR